MKKILLHASRDNYPDEAITPEDYQIEDNVDAEEYGRGLIDSFNATLRPGESPRTFIKVTVEASLGPILLPKEFLEEVQVFQKYLRDARISENKENFYEIYECMIETGEVTEVKRFVEKIAGSEEKFQRLLSSPIENLRWTVTYEESEEGQDEELASDPFDNIHPKGIVKGGISIGVYADPMSMASSQLNDFENLECYIDGNMGNRKYYTTRLQHPIDVLKGNYDLVVLDYGGMTIPGMSGMGGAMAQVVQKILEDKPSTMVWLASTYTVRGYMDYVEDEIQQKHPNLLMKAIHEEASWAPLLELWNGEK